MSTSSKRLIIGISGASGVAHGVRLLELLRPTDIETHLVMSKAAEMTLAYETDYTAAQVRALADVSHANADVGAGPASGSFRSLGMIVAPCSIRSMFNSWWRSAARACCGVGRPSDASTRS